MPLFISPTRLISIEWGEKWNTDWKAIRDRFFLGTIQREAKDQGEMETMIFGKPDQTLNTRYH